MTGELDLLGPLILAFVLSALIGLERELRRKVAGLRTHTLVGLGASMFTLVGKYGFADILVPGRVVQNPSQLASQVVTGIGFLGGGIIVVRHGSARGIITAASIWVVAAVGMAAGAGLGMLAITGTVAILFTTSVFTPFVHRLRRNAPRSARLFLVYRPGMDTLHQAIAEATRRGFAVADLSVAAVPAEGQVGSVNVQIRGTGSAVDLVAALSELDGMVTVESSPVDSQAEDSAEPRSYL
jgi:putative Mg2+ transporter-C (MgtC) family protein